MARQSLHCHGHAGLFPHRHGAGIHCSPECEAQHRADQLAAEAELQKAGFTQSKEIPNLWELNGVHISIEEVLREGMDKTLALHRAAVAERL